LDGLNLLLPVERWCHSLSVDGNLRHTPVGRDRRYCSAQATLLCRVI